MKVAVGFALACEPKARCDEDIPTTVTTTSPTTVQIQGPITQARARQLNYQVLSFLETLPNLHEICYCLKPMCLLHLGIMDLARS